MDFKRFTNKLSDEITSRDHYLVVPEHLLIALLKQPEIIALLGECNVRTEPMEVLLDDYLNKEHHRLNKNPDGLTDQAATDQKLDNIVNRANVKANTHGKGREVTTVDVFLEIFSERDCYAAKLLSERVRRYDLQKVLANIKKNEIVAVENVSGDDEKGASALQKYCTNLNLKALDDDIDPIIGREEELERVVDVLCRRRKKNPLLVGDPGVGKTAIAEGLARNIVNGDVPKVMEYDEIYTLEMGALIAGTRYRGDFEERVKAVVEDLVAHQKALADGYAEVFGDDEDLIRPPTAHLFIDEIHTLVGAGSTGGSLDAANILKPALAKGRISVIGATTYKEYRQHFEKDKALARRFQPIQIDEPSVEDTIDILKGLQETYEDEHNVKYTDEAIEKAVKLAKRYIHSRKMPDSAFDVIDEAGAHSKARSESGRVKKEIGLDEIEAAVAKIARIPPKQVSSDDKQVLADLETNLKSSVFGQDHAIDEVSSAIKLARAGLREEGKPVGCYLFEGPTGVGKTEVAKKLAEELGLNFERIDMSEYMEKHSVARLIGAPPGYVGYDQGGILTDAVDQTPYTLVLVDEIEKAHPDVYNIFLQVMDYGKLTDGNGKKVNFENVILIMTTNAGASQRSKLSIGFGTDSANDNENEELMRIFTPEFRNRLDAIISFNNLKPKHMQAIVDKFIKLVEDQLGERKIGITLSEDARAWLAEEGFDEQMGARPIARVIQEQVKKRLSDEILFGKLQHGGSVHITFNKESDGANPTPLRFDFRSAVTSDSEEPKLLTFNSRRNDPNGPG